MTSKRPHDQRFWETDEWELCGWIEMTQMLLLYISAHLYVVFLKRMNEHSSICTLVQLHVCEWRTKPYLVCLCLPLYLIVWVLYFLMYLYPLRPVERLLAALCVCAYVCVFVCVCVDAGCTVDSTLSDFVSGFLTHVLMAIKDFSLFGIHFFWTVCSFFLKTIIVIRPNFSREALAALTWLRHSVMCVFILRWFQQFQMTWFQKQMEDLTASLVLNLSRAILSDPYFEFIDASVNFSCYCHF